METTTCDFLHLRGMHLHYNVYRKRICCWRVYPRKHVTLRPGTFLWRRRKNRCDVTRARECLLIYCARSNAKHLFSRSLGAASRDRYVTRSWYIVKRTLCPYGLQMWRTQTVLYKHVFVFAKKVSLLSKLWSPTEMSHVEMLHVLLSSHRAQFCACDVTKKQFCVWRFPPLWTKFREFACIPLLWPWCPDEKMALTTGNLRQLT